MPTKRGSKAPVIRANGQVTRHELAIRMLVDSHPEIHRNGFREAVNGLWLSLQDSYDEDRGEYIADAEMLEEAPRMDFKPDAYRLDDENCHILLYEVEDTHPIPPAKLRKLAMFWFAWDAEGDHEWLPRLFIVDRYGSIQSEIDLMAVYHAFAQEMA